MNFHLLEALLDQLLPHVNELERTFAQQAAAINDADTHLRLNYDTILRMTKYRDRLDEQLALLEFEVCELQATLEAIEQSVDALEQRPVVLREAYRPSSPGTGAARERLYDQVLHLSALVSTNEDNLLPSSAVQQQIKEHRDCHTTACVLEQLYDEMLQQLLNVERQLGHMADNVAANERSLQAVDDQYCMQRWFRLTGAPKGTKN